MDMDNQNTINDQSASNSDDKNEEIRQTNELNPQNDELEFYRQILKQTDAILEDDVLKNLKNFLVKGGKPQEVIKYLSEGYRGYAQMCNLICRWLRIVGLTDGEIIEIIESYMHQLIVENFDEKKADEIFNVETVTYPTWLKDMIQHSIWRKMIYDLSEKNRDCLLLNFGIQQISIAGHDDEIASLKSASTYFNIFNKVLVNSLSKMMDQDENTIDQYLNDFKKTCDHSEHTFLYAQSILNLLQKENNGYNIKRIIQELESSLSDKSPLIYKMNFHMTKIHQYPIVQSALLSILNSKLLSPADVIKLYQEYSSNNPPPVEYIRRSDFFDLLLKALYDPSKIVDVSLKDKYFYLLAYASCVKDDRSVFDDIKDSKPIQKPEEITQIIGSLKKLEEICNKNPFGIELRNISTEIIKHLQYPIVSMGALVWIRLNLTSPELLTSTYNTLSHVVYLGLLREISFLQPLQRSIVLSILVQSFNCKLNTDPIQELNYKETLLDNMIYLMECGYIFPVLNKMRQWSTIIDQSLIRHFVLNVLNMIEPPYSPEFLNSFLEILSSISKESLLLNENKPILDPFINYCMEIKDKLTSENQEYIDNISNVKK